MKPVNNYVLVKKDDPVERTEGGLFLPTNSNARVTAGVVESVGPNAVLNGTGVKAGTRVRFSDRAGVEIDDKYLVLKDTDILCLE